MNPDGSGKGGAFLTELTTPGNIFTPEDLGPDARALTHLIHADRWLRTNEFKVAVAALGGVKEVIAACADYFRQRDPADPEAEELGLMRARLGDMAARCFALESTVYRLAGQLDRASKGVATGADDAIQRSFHAMDSMDELRMECGIVEALGYDIYSSAVGDGIRICDSSGYPVDAQATEALVSRRKIGVGERPNEADKLAIVSTLLRCEEAGRLNVASATEEALDAPCADARDSEDVADLPARLKCAALLLLHLSRAEWGEHLWEEPEVVAAIADIVSAAYVCESAVLRSEKLADAGAASVALAHDAALLYTVTAMFAAQPIASAVVDHLAHMNGNSEVAGRLMGELMVWGRHDVIGIRRRLAAAVLEREGYPWQWNIG